MRVSALIQLSALAASPLALLGINAIGDSRVPVPPAPTPPQSEANSPGDAQPAAGDRMIPIAPPEAFAAEASGVSQAIPVPAAPQPSPKLYQMRSNSSPQPSPAVMPSVQVNPSSRAIAAPEQMDLAWDRIVARSIGLDDSTYAAVTQAATPPNPAQSLLPEAAALDTQSAAPAEQAIAATADLAATDNQTVTQETAQETAAPETAPGLVQEPTAIAAESSEPAASVTSAGETAAADATVPPVVQSVQAIAQSTAMAIPVAQTQPASSGTGATAIAQLPAATLPAATLPAAAIDPAYRLGPGDVLQINFFNVPEYSGQQRVLVDGTVNLPAVGAVSVRGLTLAEAEQTIASIYSRELRNIRVTVSLAQARPLRVGVAGEVRQPGYYVLSSSDAQTPSVAQAIQTAGGVTQLADLRQVQVRRVGQNGVPETFTVNLWALLEQGDLSQNLTLRDGDTIVLAPTASLTAAESEQLAASNLASSAAQAINIALVGEVGRPGAYKLDSSGSNRPTLTQAIQAAGGVTPDANLRKIEVQRTARNGTVQTTTLDLWQLVTAGDLSQDLILQSGDRITIAKAEAMTPEEMTRLTGSNVSPTNIRINIVGEAASPGSVQLPANTTLNQALLAAGGFNRRARRTVQLIRINPNGSLTQREIQIDLERPVDPETNPILFNNDVIVVRRTPLASFSDGASNILEPIFRILPIFGLF